MVVTLPNFTSNKRVYSVEAGNFPNMHSSETKETGGALVLISSQKIIITFSELKKC